MPSLTYRALKETSSSGDSLSTPGQEVHFCPHCHCRADGFPAMAGLVRLNGSQGRAGEQLTAGGIESGKLAHLCCSDDLITLPDFSADLLAAAACRRAGGRHSVCSAGRVDS